MFGNPEVTTGGNAMKYYASVRLDVRKAELIKISDVTVGAKTRVKIAKNKVAPPFKITEFDIIYGKGISRSGTALDMAVQYGIAKKAGAWYSYNDEKIGQGRENAKTFLEEHIELLEEMEDKIKANFEGAKIEEEVESEIAEELDELEQFDDIDVDDLV